MSFIWPTLLSLLLLIPIVIVLYVLQLKRRQQIITTITTTMGSLGFPQQRVHHYQVRQHIPSVLFMIALALLLIGLARPQATVSLPRQESTILLVFDVSGSMAAEDMLPTRMEAAKALARTLVENQPRNTQIGVVAFSDNGFAVQAPTNDKEAILASINRLSPQRGTSLGQAVLTALTVLTTDPTQPRPLYSNLTPTVLPSPTPVPPGTFSSSAIILLSDGENNQAPDPLATAQLAMERGIRIYTVGIGSQAGATLRINGFLVRTQLDEQLMQEIAQLTSGTYYSPGNQQNLQQIYDNIATQFSIRPEKIEVTALFAGVGMILLIIGGACSLLWFSRVP
jgi:Ca-activated chloride channel homolog